MSATLDSLNGVLTNVQGNKVSIAAAIAQAQSAAGTLSPDVQSAIDLLRATFSNPQQIGSIISAQIQLETMQKTSAEIDALIAALQVVISDEVLLEATESQQVANSVPSPLPSAPAASASDTSAQGPDGNLAAAVAETLGSGDTVATDKVLDGATAS